MAVAALLTLASVNMASATVYHVSGSTAYRVADVSAEVAIVGTTGKATYYGSSLTGANYSVVESSDGSTVFENYFNGSIAGDEALVDGVTKLNFPNAAVNLPTGPLTLASGLTAASGGTSAPSTTPTGVPQNNTISFTGENDNAFVDIAFSDVAFATAQQVILASADTTTKTPAHSAIVGVVPFVFVANSTPDVTDIGTAGLNNGSTSIYPVLSMNPQNFTETWSSAGSTPLSFFTGLPADSAIVYPLGRDVDSGTRGTALAETGYPLTAGSGIITAGLTQYYPYGDVSDLNNNNNNTNPSAYTTTAGVLAVDASYTHSSTNGINPTNFGFAPVPVESIDGYNMGYGDGGYYSGGNLAIAIATAFDSSVTQSVEMTYLGVSDASTALTAATSKVGSNAKAATLMNYCGNTFFPTQNFPATGTITSSALNANQIYTGKYTFWGLEHEYSTAAAATEADLLKTKLAPSTGTGLDTLSANNVTYSALSAAGISRAGGDGSNVQ